VAFYFFIKNEEERESQGVFKNALRLFQSFMRSFEMRINTSNVQVFYIKNIKTTIEKLLKNTTLRHFIRSRKRNFSG